MRHDRRWTMAESLQDTLKVGSQLASVSPLVLPDPPPGQEVPDDFRVRRVESNGSVRWCKEVVIGPGPWCEVSYRVISSEDRETFALTQADMARLYVLVEQHNVMHEPPPPEMRMRMPPGSSSSLLEVTAAGRTVRVRENLALIWQAIDA